MSTEASENAADHQATQAMVSGFSERCLFTQQSLTHVRRESYQYYDLPFCRLGGDDTKLKHKREGLGEVVDGNRQVRIHTQLFSLPIGLATPALNPIVAAMNQGKLSACCATAVGRAAMIKAVRVRGKALRCVQAATMTSLEVISGTPEHSLNRTLQVVPLNPMKPHCR